MYEPDRAQFSVASVDVTILLPCLNEIQALPHCLTNAHAALRRIEAEYGFSGEILVSDNGSTDGSQALALSLGARVEPVPVRGYGAALIAGCHAARGRFILMGDADGSYDFNDGVAMIGKLAEGSALCMGSRFDGGITPGAMPWKNRHVGNPLLTGMLNLFFRSGINDAHCGLRAIRKESFQRLRLSGTGMEFASEMVIKAALLKLPISQVPAKLLPDLRDRAPHLRPWRDGWRHLRYLLMLAPNWLFGLPAIAAVLFGVIVLAKAAMQYFMPGSFPSVGDYWTIIGSASFTIGHLAMILTCAGQVYALHSGYREPGRVSRAVARVATLENALIGGLTGIAAGAGVLTLVYIQWVARNYGMADSIFLPILGTLLLTVGIQTVMGGFFLAILGGHEAQFLAATASRADRSAGERVDQLFPATTGR
ncbi:MAG: glycosyltransferase family 2 protein [Sphingobium sp.]|nr:glycosyltransferase family 2 protein [Sphingobium sp.]